MTAQEALQLLEAQAQTVGKIKNFIESYDRGLIQSDRFVKLVKYLFHEPDEEAENDE